MIVNSQENIEFQFMVFVTFDMLYQNTKKNRFRSFPAEFKKTKVKTNRKITKQTNNDIKS